MTYLLHIEHADRPAVTIRGLSYAAAFRELMKFASICIAKNDEAAIPVKIVIKQEAE